MLIAYLHSPRWLSQTPRFSTHFEWWMKASNRFCENTCQLLCVAWEEHDTSAGMSRILWFSELCPPVLPSAMPAPLAVGKNHLHAAGVGRTCRSYQCLSLDISSIMFCLQLYTHAHYPSSPLELVLGFCPYCEHTEGFTVFVRGQISVVLGWEAWWVSQDLLRRMGNDFFIKFLICMLIAMLLKITLF